MSKKKETNLGITVQQDISNSDPTHDTQSQANPLKRVVTVGRTPETKEASHSSIETLRPTGGN